MDEEFTFGFVGEKDVVPRFEPEIQRQVPQLGRLNNLATRIEVGVPIIA